MNTYNAHFFTNLPISCERYSHQRVYPCNLYREGKRFFPSFIYPKSTQIPYCFPIHQSEDSDVLINEYTPVPFTETEISFLLHSFTQKANMCCTVLPCASRVCAFDHRATWCFVEVGKLMNRKGFFETNIFVTFFQSASRLFLTVEFTLPRLCFVFV